MTKLRITKVDALKQKPTSNDIEKTGSLLETGQVDLTPVAKEILRANKGKYFSERIVTDLSFTRRHRNLYKAKENGRNQIVATQID